MAENRSLPELLDADRRQSPRSTDAFAHTLQLCAENEGRTRRAVDLLRAGRQDEALEVLEEALGLLPEIWGLRGEFTLRLREELEALRTTVQLH